MLVAAGIKLAARKMQIAAQVVNLGERAVIGGGARRRFCFRQRSEGFVEPGEQSVGRGGADQRSHADSFRAAIGKRAAIGFERLLSAPGVKLEIGDLQGKVEADLRIGRDGQSPARKCDRLVLPEERVLIFRSCKVGARRVGIGRQVEMLGPERWLAG